MACPFEWQSKENLVYCDYLEHLLLHILICKYPSDDKVDIAEVGVGGILNFIVPELNDFYSGWNTNQTWRKNCHNRIKNDKDVYLNLLKQFTELPFTKTSGLDVFDLFSCYNEKFGLWHNDCNKDLYGEILKFINESLYNDIMDMISK